MLQTAIHVTYILSLGHNVFEDILINPGIVSLLFQFKPK